MHTCDIIDVHFKQGVDGCEGYQVTVNETSWLDFHWTAYQGNFPPGNLSFDVFNDDCAVNKTPEPIEKWSQVVSVNGIPLEPPYPVYFPKICEHWMLDVETSWELVKEIDYTKSINWFGISFVEGKHPCVLFELEPGVAGSYFITLVPSADVELVGATDVNPGNDSAMGPPLYILVSVPP